MKLSRRRIVALLSAAPVVAQQPAAPPKAVPAGAKPTPATPPAAAQQADPILKAVAENPILRAMMDELQRSRQLRVVAGRDPLYYLEYGLDDAESYSVAATLGALQNERRNRFRIPHVSARIGEMAFDNTNYVFSDYYFGSRFDPDQFPLDDDYSALRQAFWLATDRAFKGAIEAIARKRAALRNVTQAEKLPDFTTAAVVQKVLPTVREKVDEAMWKQRVVALSAIFNAYPEVFESGVEFDGTQSTSYVVSSESLVAVSPDLLFSVRIRATGQAPDGMRIRDHSYFHAASSRKLPIEADLRRAATEVADHVKALASAPLGETYTGPVLFDGPAAAQLFAELLGTALQATRRPVSEPSRPLQIPPAPFEGRIGSRVLPDSFTVVDDPTQTEWRGRPLLGAYPFDSEGVAPQPLTVVEKGLLTALLSTRQPTRDSAISNGRARLPGAFGAKAAAISNLFVKSSSGVPAAELRAQFTKLITARNKPFGLLVKKMDFPSAGSLAELRRLATGQDRPTSMPLLVYRVYPDGREELVRGLRLRGFNARSLKDIVGASSEEFAFDFLGNLAPFSMAGGGGYVYPSTVVAPSVLFEELELDRLEQDLPKLPLVPAPSVEE